MIPVVGPDPEPVPHELPVEEPVCHPDGERDDHQVEKLADDEPNVVDVVLVVDVVFEKLYQLFTLLFRILDKADRCPVTEKLHQATLHHQPDGSVCNEKWWEQLWIAFMWGIFGYTLAGRIRQP